jgi:AcrR family transcriptional regulator
MTQPTPIATPRVPMSRDRVLAAGMRITDRGGIQALSMRKLANELGVEAMTLYYYVTNKADLLDGMVDVVASEIELPSPGVDWKTAARSRAVSAHDAFLRHPWAGPLWSAVSLGPGRMRYMDVGLRILREGGFPPESTERAFHAIENHVVGYTLQAQACPFDDDELAEVGANALKSISRDEYPYLVEHIAQHLEAATLDEGDFEFGLDLILEGVERLRSAS